MRFKQFVQSCIQSDVRLVHVCNYILFTLFTFLFFYGLQQDVITLTMQNRLGVRCPGLSVCMPYILTALLLSLKIALNKLLRLKGRHHALSFVPLFALMVFLTILEPHFSLFKAAIQSFVLLLYVPFISRLRGAMHYGDHFQTLLIPNLIVMLSSFVFVTLMANTSDVLHYELRLQRHLNNGHVEAALAVAQLEQATSQRLTALRAYALSHKDELGENLFSYPIPKGRSDLFLHQTDERYMLYPLDSVKAFVGWLPRQTVTIPELIDRLSLVTDTLRKPPMADYLLCTLLLKKDLGAFVHWLPRFYDVGEAERLGNLPRHYREALILYKALSLSPAIVFHSNQTETNFRDFKELARQYPDTRVRRNQLRSVYGDTYWWYYWYH